MGIEDRDYFRERKFSWVTGELLKPTNEQPLNQGKKMGIQDRDYMRERKLDYSSKYDTPVPQQITRQQPPDIPVIWFVLALIIAGFCTAFWLLGHWR